MLLNKVKERVAGFPLKAMVFSLRAWWKENWSIILLLSTLVLLSYFNSLGNDLVIDDVQKIHHQPQLGQIGHVFRHPMMFLRPLFYFFIYHLFGRAPVYYRLLNIFFHLGATILAYHVVRQIMGRWVGVVAAMLFAVHPVMIEAVTWISGGAYSQYGFFFLLSFWLYLNADKSKLTYYLSLFVYLLTLFSSSKSFVLGGVFVFYEFALGGWDNLKSKWKELLPFVFISTTWGLYHVSLVGQRQDLLVTKYHQLPQKTGPMLYFTLQLPWTLTKYFELLFWPKNLCFYQIASSLAWRDRLIRMGFSAVYFILLVWTYLDFRKIFFWLGWFLIPLAPFLTPLGIASWVAERYIYLPSLGIFVAAAYLLNCLRQKRRFKLFVNILVVIMLIALWGRTVTRNRDWENLYTLSLATVQTNPASFQGHYNLAANYLAQGRLRETAAEIEKAIEITPHRPKFYDSLGDVYRQLDELPQAKINYLKALAIDSSLWESHMYLGVVYSYQGEYDFALEELRRAQKLSPDNPRIWANFGVVYERQGAKEEALTAYQEAYVLSKEGSETWLKVKRKLRDLRNEAVE